MKEEYGFSKGQRGKFFAHDAQLIAPVHLDAEIAGYLTIRAEARGATSPANCRETTSN